MTEKTPELDSSTSNASGLPHPDKITIAWLLHNVSLKMWLAALTLLASFFYTEIELIKKPIVQQMLGLSVSNDVNEQEINILKQQIKEKNLEVARLEGKTKKNVHMPLEGIWEYSTHYTKYFGKPDSITDPIKYAHGRAAFIWYEDQKQYHVLMGGGVHDGKLKQLIATHVIESPLESDDAGNPIDGAMMSGRYLARTTSIRDYESHSDQIVVLRDLVVEHNNDKEVKSMTFKIHISDRGKISDGVVTFRKPPPL